MARTRDEARRKARTRVYRRGRDGAHGPCFRGLRPPHPGGEPAIGRWANVGALARQAQRLFGRCRSHSQGNSCREKRSHRALEDTRPRKPHRFLAAGHGPGTDARDGAGLRDRHGGPDAVHGRRRCHRNSRSRAPRPRGPGRSSLRAHVAAASQSPLHSLACTGAWLVALTGREARPRVASAPVLRIARGAPRTLRVDARPRGPR